MSAPRPSPDPLYDTPDASRAQAGRSQQPARTVSLRERLLITRPVWLQLRANAAAALHVLRTEPPGVSLSPSGPDWPAKRGRGEEKAPQHGGTEPPNLVHLQTFLVRKSNTRQCQALCVRLPEASGPSFVSSHYIQESPGGEGAGLAGRGWRQAGEGGPRRTASLPMSLRRLFGGFRAHVPGPGPAHLCILPYQVSLPVKHLVTTGPASYCCPPPAPKHHALLTTPFADLRDILLLPLRLPRAIHQAATHKELEAISHLGMGKGSLQPTVQMNT